MSLPAPSTTHHATHEPSGTDVMTVDAAAATGSLRTLGTGAAQAAPGNDSRLSDARTPTAHAASHAGGSDDLETTLDGRYVLKSLLTAKGALYVATSSGVIAQHAAGNDGEIPLWDSNATDGIRNAAFQEAKRCNDLLGWTFDPTALVSGNVLGAAARLFLAKIPLPRQISVTNVILSLQAAAGSTLTHCYAALFKSDGTIIGQSADQSALWQSGASAALKTIALASGPFTVTPLAANDFVWAGIYVGTAAGTLPAFHRGFSSSSGLTNVGLTTARSRSAQLDIADTTTLTNITPSGLTPASAPYWAAIS